MNTRCKFQCVEVKHQKQSQNVLLEPVTSDSAEENKSFSKYTPAGKLELTITNEKIFNVFVPGNDYYIDISPAN